MSDSPAVIEPHCFFVREGCGNTATKLVNGRYLALQCCEAHVSRMENVVGQPCTVHDLHEFLGIRRGDMGEGDGEPPEGI